MTKVQSTKVRAEPNQRLDLVDYSKLSQTSQEAIEAAARALLSSPKATPGVPTGERWTGSITANPTAGDDGLLRINSSAFVGLTSAGELVIKPNGVELSVSIPDGENRVYAYVKDVPEDTQMRRFLPATAPFDEFDSAIDVANRSTPDLYVTADGGVQAQAVVAGKRRALLYLGDAFATGGVVSFSAAPNTLETVREPASTPATDRGTTTSKTTVTGASSTLRELVNTALYKHAVSVWKGSDHYTPTDANNHGAYEEPAGGVDKAFRQALNVVTIGDGTTTFGDVDVNKHTDAQGVMNAAFDMLPAVGGTIYLKPGVTLSNFDAVTVALPAMRVKIVGDHSTTPDNAPHFVFAAQEGFVCNVNGSLELENLHISYTDLAVQVGESPCSVRNVWFEFADDEVTATNAAIQGSTVTGLTLEDVVISTNVNTASAHPAALNITGPANRINVRRLHHRVVGGIDCGMIAFTDVRDEFMLDDVFYDNAATANAGDTIAVKLATTITLLRSVRFVRNLRCTSISGTLLDVGNVSHLVVEDLNHGGTSGFSMLTVTSSLTGFVVFRNCFMRLCYFNGSIADVLFENCTFVASGAILGTAGAVVSARFTNCQFVGANIGVSGANVAAVYVDNCMFLNVTMGNPQIPSTDRTGVIAISPADYVGNVVVTNCRFEGVQNINYGASNSNEIAIVTVASVNARSVICRGNTVRNVMASSSGAERKAPYVLHCTSKDGNISATQWGTIVCEGNTIGDQTSFCRLVRVFNVLADNIAINDNTLTTRFEQTLSLPKVWLMTDVALNDTREIKNFSYCRNVIYVNNSANENINSALLTLYAPYFIHSCSIQSNVIAIASGGQTWALAIVIGSSITNLAFKNNVATRNTAGGSAWFNTFLGTPPTRSIPSVPSPSDPWPDNILIHHAGA